MDNDKFIFCLEVVPDVETVINTEVFRNLGQIALEQGITSIYRTCDTIEGVEEGLSALRYDDHNFKDYEIIYLVMPGEGNSICVNEYYYSLTEMAELFEGKLTGKILHFANIKVLDLDPEEAQYFLDVTGARAVSGYGEAMHNINSINLDKAFFSLCQDQDDLIEIVEELHEKHYGLCKLLDFRLYY
ncbi:hypothetical protein FQU23_008850 [Flavobacterium sp. XN-5]|uniref:DUF6642 family protein n=1 Tax=Flavobacterium sp. XN-5 TaxID=2599390 RepID=UPI0011C95E22|nr:DUF6642 family protein [Flavobacterium sp. XN-5]NGY37621.1 hypothetical protein [Flavobacterium sp. XN-5]